MLEKWSTMSTRLWNHFLNHRHFLVPSIANSTRLEMTFVRLYTDVGERTCMGCFTRKLWQTKFQRCHHSIQTTARYITHLTVLPACSYYWSTSQCGNDGFCCDVARNWYSWMPRTKLRSTHCHYSSSVFTPTQATQSRLWSSSSKKIPCHCLRRSASSESMFHSGLHLHSCLTHRKWKSQLSPWSSLLEALLLLPLRVQSTPVPSTLLLSCYLYFIE